MTGFGPGSVPLPELPELDIPGVLVGASEEEEKIVLSLAITIDDLSTELRARCSGIRTEELVSHIERLVDTFVTLTGWRADRELVGLEDVGPEEEHTDEAVITFLLRAVDNEISRLGREGSFDGRERSLRSKIAAADEITITTPPYWSPE